MDAEFDVFLSHNNLEKPLVKEIARRLRHSGLRTWLDEWNLIPGDPWQEKIEEALKACSTCAVFIGKSGTSPWHNEEMRAAIKRRVRGRGRVIPVLLPGAECGDPNALPDFLAASTWVDFRQGLDDENAFYRLVCGIKGITPGSGPGEAIFEGRCPYRGLEPFDVEDSIFFHGREALVRWMLDKLRVSQQGARFLAIVGPSGSGKSSLARAGLLAKLNQGALPGSKEWPVAVCRPGAQPLESLARSLPAAAGIGDTPVEIDRFIQALGENSRLLHSASLLALRGGPPGRRLVVLVDQFEEIFTFCQEEKSRLGLIENLLHAATVADGQTVVLLTLRSDFLGKCAAYPRLAATLSDHLKLVGPMSPEELRSAIEQPARSAGRALEPGLVELLIQEVGGQPGYLPLLQHALLLLWQRSEGRNLTVAAYREIGRVAGALQRHAEGVFHALSDDEKEICRRVLLLLVQPGTGAEDTRRRATRDELIQAGLVGGERRAVERIIGKLADERLIITEAPGEDRSPLVELAHEALIDAWSALREWIDRDRATLVLRRRLDEEMNHWEENGRDASFLWGGAKLAQAEEWAEIRPDELNSREQEFIQAGIAQRNRHHQEELEDNRQQVEMARVRALEQERANRKLRRIVVALAALLALVSLLVGLAMYQKRQTTRLALLATWRSLLLEAEAALAGEPELGLLLALEALGLEEKHDYLRPPAAESTLRKALASSVGTPLGAGEVHAAAVSPDQRWLVTAGAGNILRRWDLKAKDPMRAQTLFKGLENRADKIAISPDGRFVAAYSPDQQDQKTEAVLFWDLEKKTSVRSFVGDDWLGPTPFSGDGRWLVTRKYGLRLRRVLASEVRELPVYPTAIAFHPRKPWLAAGDSRGSVSVWRLADPSDTPQNQFPAPGGETRALAFSPDGDWLVSAGAEGAVTGWRSSSGSWGEPIPFHGCAGPLDSLEFDPGGVWLFGWGRSPSACLWKLADPAALACDLLGPDLLGADKAETTAATFSPGPGGQRLFTAHKGALRRWELKPDRCAKLEWRHEGPPITLLAGADGKRLLTGGVDRAPRLLDLAKSNPFDPDEPRILRTPGGPFTVVVLSSDGRSLAAGGSGGKILLRNLEPPAGPVHLDGQREPVTALAFSPDRARLVSGGAGGAIHLWGLAARKPRPAMELRRHRESVAALALSGEKGWLVAGGQTGGTFSAWKLPATAPVEWNLANHPDGVSALAFSGNGRWLVTAGADGQARAYRSPGYGAAPPMPLPQKSRGGITAMALSRNGGWLATASADGPTRLWRLPLRNDEEPMALPREHSGALTALAFSADGSRLAGGGRDGAVRLWELEQKGPPRRSVVLPVQEQEIRALAFSPDGHRLVAADADGTARRWNLRLGELKKRACEKAGRNLTADEWRNHFRSEGYRTTCPDWPAAP